MSLQDRPKKYSPEELAAFEAAYNDIYRLYARTLRSEAATKELEIALRKSFKALVTDGVADPKELRRRAFKAAARGIR